MLYDFIDYVMSFVHLHGHSTYSFLEAIGKPKAIVAKAKSLEMEAIGITDYNGMYGMVDFYKSAKNENIKPIVGLELQFVMDLETLVRQNHLGNICLLAKNKEGYLNLLKLTSQANMQWLSEKADQRKIDINTLKELGKEIIVFMWGEHSWIGKMITNREKSEKTLEIINMLVDIFGKENVRGEIMAQDYERLPAVKRINEEVLKLSQEAGIDCFAAVNFHYQEKDDKDAWEMALAIKDGYKMYDEQRRKPKGEYYIATEDEVKHLLGYNGHEEKDIEKRIANTQKIADMCEVEIDLHQTLFPNYESPENITKLYEANKKDLIEKR